MSSCNFLTPSLSDAFKRRALFARSAPLDDIAEWNTSHDLNQNGYGENKLSISITITLWEVILAEAAGWETAHIGYENQ
jgi:hypothetical protein